MKKWILAVIMAAMTVLNIHAVTHAKVQLWEGGPYWATTNIGADNPWDYGLYFWWGDTTGYRSSGTGFGFMFARSNCFTYEKNSDTLRSEGWITSNGVLAPSHDAAHVHWGGGWRMPTYQELYDLCHNKCDWTWTTQNGVNGYVVRGRGAYVSNSIFLPAAGYGEGWWLFDSGSYGRYWSSVPYKDLNARGLGFYSSGYYTDCIEKSSRCIGRSIRPVQGFGEEVLSVVYNANGGTGTMGATMESQSFESGKKQKLLKNIYHKDGYVFQGWVSNSVERAELAAAGVIAVDYTDEQEITVDSDMTLYAVWANPPLTLTAESANWSNGSITLKCEDSDTSGTAHTYSLEYKNESGVWTNVNDVAATSIARSADGFAHLTDTTFWSRLGGIPTVEYRVKEEKSGRVSAGCVTRNRFLLSVGYSDFLTKNKPKRGYYNDASEFRDLCIERGEFLSENAHFRSNAGATTEKVRGEMSYFVAHTQPGDIFVFYISTHGGDFRNKVFAAPGIASESALATYDSTYRVSMLQEDIRKFSSGVAVVNVIMACHSFSLTGGVDVRETVNEWLANCGFGQCLGNVTWITSCDAQESSYTYDNEVHSWFGESFIVNGFKHGCADMELYGTEYTGGNVDGLITIGELGRYAKEFFKGVSDDMPSSVQLDENQGLLDRIVLGRRMTVPTWIRPATPTNVKASDGEFNEYVKVDWDDVASATCYKVYRYPLSSPDEWKWLGLTKGTSSFCKDKTTILTKEYGYRIRAVNPIGVSDLSYVAVGSRGTPDFVEYLISVSGATTTSADEYDAMEKTTAANGCRTVGQCYAVGVNPEDPNDDLKISHFEMKDGKPVITLNHTEDGSGNSFVPRVKTLGKANLLDTEWREVPEDGNPAMRFFKVSVEMP